MGLVVAIDAGIGLKKLLIGFVGAGLLLSILIFLLLFVLPPSTLPAFLLTLSLDAIHVRALMKLGGIVVEEMVKLPELCIVVVCEMLT